MKITRRSATKQYKRNRAINISGSSSSSSGGSSSLSSSASSSSSDLTNYGNINNDVDIVGVWNFTGGLTATDITLSGNLTIAGQINEVETEIVKSENDYMYLRYGNTTALADGAYTGIEAINYDGTNNGLLVFGNDGIARVGDSGDLQAIATREDSPLSNGIAYYDTTTNKFLTKSEISMNVGFLDGLTKAAFLRSDINSETASGVSTKFGGAVEGQSGSGATVQINGFQRTGAIYVHSGKNTPNDTRASDCIFNSDAGDLMWFKYGIGEGKIWHSLNDGANSGLDADLLDGYDSDEFAILSEDEIVTGSWSFAGVPKLNNNVFLSAKDTSGTTHRVFGVGSLDDIYMGGIDTANTNDIHFRHSGLDSILLEAAKVTIYDAAYFKNTVISDSYIRGSLLYSNNLSNTIIGEGYSKVDGYGLISNRDSMYITNANGGDIRFGLGTTHGSDNKMTLSSTGLGIGILEAAYDLHVVGTGYFSDNLKLNANLSSPTFLSGFTGNGWKLDADYLGTGENKLTVDNLTVRGSMNIYELIVNQIRATNGSLWVSDSFVVTDLFTIDSITVSTIYTEENELMTFGVGDYVMMQKFSGNDVNKITAKVTATGTSTTYPTRQYAILTIITSSRDVKEGDVFVRYDSTSEDRRGALYLTSSDDYSPYMDITKGTGTGSYKPYLRLGKLDGVNSETGYGLWGSSDSVNTSFIISSDGYAKIAGWNFNNESIYTDRNDVSFALGAFKGDWASSVYGIQLGTDTSNRMWMGEINGDYDFSVIVGGEYYLKLGSISNYIGSWNFDADYLYTAKYGVSGGIELKGGNTPRIMIHSSTGNYVNQYYTSSSNWGLRGQVDNEYVFQLGSTNNIAGWAFNTTSLYKDLGTYTLTMGEHSNTSSKGFHVMKDDTTNGLSRISIGYISDTSWGIWGTVDGSDVFRLGNSNYIAGWNFNSEKLYSGNISLDSSGAIENTNGMWGFNNDGSFNLSSGLISGDSSGNLTIEGSAIVGEIVSANYQADNSVGSYLSLTDGNFYIGGDDGVVISGQNGQIDFLADEEEKYVSIGKFDLSSPSGTTGYSYTDQTISGDYEQTYEDGAGSTTVVKYINSSNAYTTIAPSYKTVTSGQKYDATFNFTLAVESKYYSTGNYTISRKFGVKFLIYEHTTGSLLGSYVKNIYPNERTLNEDYSFNISSMVSTSSSVRIEVSLVCYYCNASVVYLEDYEDVYEDLSTTVSIENSELSLVASSTQISELSTKGISVITSSEYYFQVKSMIGATESNPNITMGGVMAMDGDMYVGGGLNFGNYKTCDTAYSTGTISLSDIASNQLIKITDSITLPSASTFADGKTITLVNTSTSNKDVSGCVDGTNTIEDRRTRTFTVYGGSWYSSDT